MLLTNQNKLFKLLSIISFTLLFLALCIIEIIPNPNFYEISIYSAYPWYFWLILMFPFVMLFISILNYLKESMNDQEIEFSDIYIKLLALASILSLSIFLLLPYLRGYYLYSGGDALTHLYYIYSIGISGHFGSDNIYPIIHIFVNTIHLITGLDPKTIMFFIPLIFVLLFIISMYILSKSLKLSRVETFLVLLFSILPIFGTELLYMAPSVEAFFLIPITLFVLIKSRSNLDNSVGFSILLILLLFIFPFFHPEATLFLLVIISVLIITQWFYDKGIISSKLINDDLNLRSTSLWAPLLFLAVAFFSWFSVTIIFGSTVNQVYNSLILNLGTSPLNFYSATISRVNIQFSQLINIFIKGYGPIFFYIVVAMITVFSTALKLLLKKRIEYKKILLSNIFVVLAMMVFLFLFKDLLIGARPIKYLILVSIFLMCLTIPWIILKFKMKSSLFRKAAYICVSLLVVSTISLSFINAYPSPFVNIGNYQVQQTDYNGMKFFFNYKNSSMEIMSITMDQQRWRDLFSIGNQNLINIGSTLPEEHFGYNNDSNLGDNSTHNEYLVFNELTTQFYPELYPDYKNYWKYTPQDFERLQNDPTVNSIYNNGGITLYEVIGKKSLAP